MLSTSATLLSLPEVTRITSLSKSTIYRMVAECKLPAPVRISARRVGWKSSEIESFVSSLS